MVSGRAMRPKTRSSSFDRRRSNIFSMRPSSTTRGVAGDRVAKFKITSGSTLAATLGKHPILSGVPCLVEIASMLSIP